MQICPHMAINTVNSFSGKQLLEMISRQVLVAQKTRREERRTEDEVKKVRGGKE